MQIILIKTQNPIIFHYHCNSKWTNVYKIHIQIRFKKHKHKNLPHHVKTHCISPAISLVFNTIFQSFLLGIDYLFS